MNVQHRGISIFIHVVIVVNQRIQSSLDSWLIVVIRLLELLEPHNLLVDSSWLSSSKYLYGVAIVGFRELQLRMFLRSHQSNKMWRGC